MYVYSNQVFYAKDNGFDGLRPQTVLFGYVSHWIFANLPTQLTLADCYNIQ